jgi:hypothetical protein
MNHLTHEAAIGGYEAAAEAEGRIADVYDAVAASGGQLGFTRASGGRQGGGGGHQGAAQASGGHGGGHGVIAADSNKIYQIRTDAGTETIIFERVVSNQNTQ